jgi:hypothetical protein
MPELMGDHTAQFRRRQIGHQWQPDGQHEVVAKHAKKAATETGGRVQVAIEINPFGRRRTDRFADLLDERIEQWIVGRIERERLGAFGSPGKEGFDHEENHHRADDQWRI